MESGFNIVQRRIVVSYIFESSTMYYIMQILYTYSICNYVHVQRMYSTVYLYAQGVYPPIRAAMTHSIRVTILNLMLNNLLIYKFYFYCLSLALMQTIHLIYIELFRFKQVLVN